MINHGSGEWHCNYVVGDGRERRLLIGVQTEPLSPAAVAEIASHDVTTRREMMNATIIRIDERRREARPGGDYVVHLYGVLPAEDVPNGFLACSELQDSMTLDGSNTRNDRFHLHCWNLDVDAGHAVQVLISLIEYNPLDRPVSAELSEDYATLIAPF